MTDLERVLVAIQNLKLAIEDEGINPHYHKAQINRLREEWPSLMNSLDDLIRLSHKIGI